MSHKWHKLRTVVACVTAIVSQPLLAQDNNPYFSSIPITYADPGPNLPKGSAQLTLHAHDTKKTASALSAIDGVHIIATDENSVSISFTRKPTVSGLPEQKYLNATFVVDFEEDSVSSLSQELLSATEEVPTGNELVDYVYAHISDKTYARSFDFASQVATSGQGDCTEHAVLLAALARAAAYPSRVVFGVLIIDTQSSLYAFGHAWTEIYDGTRWQIGDGTKPTDGQEADQIWYLPLGLLSNEGPGFTLSMLQIMNTMPTTITDFAYRGQ